MSGKICRSNGNLKIYINSIDMSNHDMYYYQQKAIDMVIKMEQNLPRR
ncbi:hypothetical protein [Apibacter sp. wkB309]|nr:hypothetical protein [Apibacter sp. wkB309]